MQKRSITATAWFHLSVSLIAGAAAAVVTGSTVGWQYAPLAGWDTTALVFLGWLMATLHSSTAQETAALAGTENPGRFAADIILVTASVVSLGAIAVLIFQARKGSDSEKMIALSLNIVSVVLSWTTVHALYTLKYARIYYADKSGIDFNDKSQPAYGDFAYLAFTIGMTYQVSDTSLTSPELRRTALYHALLSYLFGAVIIASTINFIVSLSQ